MKKTIKVVGIILAVIVILLLITPFLFKGTIEKQVKKGINNSINAQVEWERLGLNFFSSFPNARLKLSGFSVVNKAPFEGDTLAAGKLLSVDMGLLQFLKSGEHPLIIDRVGLDKAMVNVLVGPEGKANYDIARQAEEDDDKGDEESSFSLDIQDYKIDDSRIVYNDKSNGFYLDLNDFNHQGSGDFTKDVFTLKTQTNTLVSMRMDSTEYLHNHKIDLQADIAMDLAKNRYEFKDNKMLINQLPLVFEGFVEMGEGYHDMDIQFKTPSSDFKNFLGVVPEDYLASLDGVETSGDFAVDGRLFGRMDDHHIPKMDIAMKSDNAAFQFPDLPKGVEDINFSAELKNETGLLEDTDLDLENLSFKIDQDVFSAYGKIKNLPGNMLVDIVSKGRLNLANISQSYPIETPIALSGVLDADLSVAFAMDDLEQERYEKIENQGRLSLTGFQYESPEFPNPLRIEKANLSFDPGNIVLRDFEMTTGETDVQIKGKLEDLMGYLFKGLPVKGTFDLASKNFVVNDFMVPDTGDEAEEVKEQPDTTEEVLKIPSFLDVVLHARADNVRYDKINLTDVKGDLILKEETARLQNLTGNGLGGSLEVNGSVSTKGDQPNFDMDFKMKEMDVQESMKSFDMLAKFAPIANAMVGKLSASFTMNGDLMDNLSPVYSSLNGEGLAKLFDAKVERDKFPLASKLSQEVKFIDFSKLDFDEITTHFKFDNGKIAFQPFTFNLNKDIKAKLQGSHSFDNKLDYTMDLQVPAKYLGSDIQSKLASLSKSDKDELRIDVPVGLTGALTNPSIKLNMGDVTRDLARHIADEQKEELKNKGKSLLQGLLERGDQSEGAKTKDTVKGKEVENKEKNTGDKSDAEKAKDVLKGIFGKKEKKKKDD